MQKKGIEMHTSTQKGQKKSSWKEKSLLGKKHGKKNP